MKLILNLGSNKSESAAPIASVTEFTTELIEYMKANPSELSKFAKAWENADSKTVSLLLKDFMSEYEDHSGTPSGALDSRGRP